MVLAEDVLEQAQKRVAEIIKEKNPDLKNKLHVVKAVAMGAIKYFDLSHNRHSDYEFDWDKALDFEGNSGPYIQYAYARLCGILSKVNLQGSHDITDITMSETERQLILKLVSFDDAVSDALKDYLPNLLANYLYELAALVNKFYHESPVMKETDEKLKYLRLGLILSSRQILGKGLSLLGIQSLEEM
jgi:arginyl-tRNA synthetase